MKTEIIPAAEMREITFTARAVKCDHLFKEKVLKEMLKAAHEGHNCYTYAGPKNELTDMFLRNYSDLLREQGYNVVEISPTQMQIYW